MRHVKHLKILLFNIHRVELLIKTNCQQQNLEMLFVNESRLLLFEVTDNCYATTQTTYIKKGSLSYEQDL